MIVVNETLAARFFGRENPIGHQIDFGSPGQPLAYEIVGVVKNTKYSRVQLDVPLTVYMPYQQAFGPSNAMTFIIRTTGDRAAIVPAIQREVQAVDGSVPLTNVRTQLEAIDQTLATERTLAVVSTCLGVLALLLASIGLYGTMAYSVTRRTNEIGIRMALGASRTGVLKMLVGESSRVIGIGALVGIVAAVGAARLIAARLYGVGATDITTIAAATILLLVVGALAAIVPARRAARLDPIVALRCD